MGIRILLVAGLLAAPLLVAAAEDPAVAMLNQRLVSLQADARTTDLAALERLQAQQAIAVLAKAKRKELDQARYLAERRVAIAEASARAEAARREAEKLRAQIDTPAMREEMRELARRQAELGRQQAELGRQQAAASVRAQREAERLIQQAIRDGLAQPVRG